MVSQFLSWLGSAPERRSVPREPGEGLLAFYWEGGAPRGHRVIDISRRGLFLETSSISWSSGTQMILTLQIDSKEKAAPEAPKAIALHTEVVRTTAHGMGLKFMFSTVSDRRKLQEFLLHWRALRASLSSVNAPPKTRHASGGQSLVEFALMLPVLMILIVNIVNFAGFYYAFVAVGNASRSAGDYTIMGGAAYPGTDLAGAYYPQLAAPSDKMSGVTTGGQLVANMIAKDMLSLNNRTSISIRICESKSNDTSSPTCNTCTNTSGSMSCATGSGSYTINPASDTSTGEGASYTLTWVDISYTFQPFIPLNFRFPGLNFGATLPGNLVLHRQSVYRVLN